MNSINHACCDDADVEVDCSIGIPSACSLDCSTAFLPMWHNCHEFLASTPSGPEFSDFADKCGQAQAAGAESRCGYVEIIPIIMACTDLAPNEDFCVRQPTASIVRAELTALVVYLYLDPLLLLSLNLRSVTIRDNT